MRTILSFLVGLPAGIAVNHYIGLPLVKECGIEKAVPFINISLALAIAFCSIRSIVRLVHTYPKMESGERKLNMEVCFFVPSFLFGIFFVFAVNF